MFEVPSARFLIIVKTDLSFFVPEGGVIELWMNIVEYYLSGKVGALDLLFNIIDPVTIFSG